MGGQEKLKLIQDPADDPYWAECKALLFSVHLMMSFINMTLTFLLVQVVE